MLPLLPQVDDLSFAFTELRNSVSNLFFLVIAYIWHCSDCIMRWWEWLQQGDANPMECNTAVTAGGAEIISFALFPFYFEFLSIFRRTVSWTPELNLDTKIS